MRNKTIIAFLAILTTLPPVFAQDATSFYKEGVKLKEQGNSALALEKFKQAASLKPDYADAIYEMGWCQNDLRKYTDALVSLRKARKFIPTIPKVHFELGYAFEKLNITDSARVSYNQCLKLKPDYSGAYKQLGYIEYDKDEYNNALSQFEKYESNVKKEITDYLYWYRKGFCNNAIKEYAKAKDALNKSLEFKKDYINTYLELGFASSKLKQDNEAIAYFNDAMKLDSKSHVPYNGIAEVYRDNKKDCNTAISWYKKSLEIKPKERKACFGIGYCLNSSEKYSEAISYLKTAVEMEPDYTAAYVELGYSYYKTNNYVEAGLSFDKAISLNPKNENARYYACLMYIKQGKRSQAQKMVDELKVLSSKHVETLQKKVNEM